MCYVITIFFGDLRHVYIYSVCTILSILYSIIWKDKLCIIVSNDWEYWKSPDPDIIGHGMKVVFIFSYFLFVAACNQKNRIELREIKLKPYVLCCCCCTTKHNTDTFPYAYFVCLKNRISYRSILQMWTKKKQHFWFDFAVWGGYKLTRHAKRTIEMAKRMTQYWETG